MSNNSVPEEEVMAVTLCFGCRANEGEPIGPADQFGTFEGGWERFTCAKCGVTDVRPIESDASNTKS